MPSVSIFGVTSNLDQIEDKNIEEGRFISLDEEARSAHVCVIGDDIRQKYFSNVSPIGKSLKLRGVPLTVVGVEAKRGELMGSSFSRSLYIPVTLHAQIFGYGQNGITIHGKAGSPEMFDAAIEEARVLLRTKRGITAAE